MSRIISLPINPLAKPRSTAQGKYNPRLKKYYTYANSLRLLWGNKEFPSMGAEVYFYKQMPKSWSKNKKTQMDGQPCVQKSRNDVDNFLKGFFDAILEDDSHIYHIGGLGKYWAFTGRIDVILPD